MSPRRGGEEPSPPPAQPGGRRAESEPQPAPRTGAPQRRQRLVVRDQDRREPGAVHRPLHHHPRERAREVRGAGSVREVF